MISVDLILFWLSQTWPVPLRIQELVCFGCTVLSDSKETELGSSHQEVSPSAGKNNGLVLVSCCVIVSLQLFLLVWVFLRFLGVICCDR